MTLFNKRNQEIRAMWQMGFSRHFIANAYGISCKQVRKIANFNKEA